MPERAVCVDLPSLSDEGRAVAVEGGVHGFRNDSDAAATMLILSARGDQHRAT